MKHFNSLFFAFLTLFLFAAAGCENHKNSPESIKTYFKILDSNKVDYLLNIFSLKESKSIGIGGLADSLRNANLHVLKFDENGDTLWTKKIIEGRTEARLWRKESDDMIRGVVYGENSPYFVTVSPTGLMSTVPIGSYAHGIGAYCKTPDGNYAIAGACGDSSFGISKVNFSGDSLWSKKYDFFSKYYYLYPTDIIPTKDGGLVVLIDVWWTTVSAGKFLIVKTNNVGDMIWSDTLHIYSRYDDSQIIEWDSGELLIGISDNDNYPPSIDLFQWSSDGDSLSTTSIQDIDVFRRMARSPTGELAIAGSDGFVLLNSDLSTKTTRKWSEWYNSEMIGNWVDADPQGWIICGWVPTGRYSGDVFILAVDEEGNANQN